MHTKKRHQNMFQDLNRKLHHAEKDRESPASDSKVTYNHVHAHYPSSYRTVTRAIQQRQR